MKTVLKSLTFAIALGLAAANTAKADVVVSSKIDTEGSVLGNIILLALNANGIKTQDRIQLGATPVVRKAITAGEIDIYPEYTGNAGFFFNKADDPVWKDAAKGFDMAKKLDFDANKIVWLDAAPANNTWAIALRKDAADANKLKSMSDFGQWITKGANAAMVYGTDGGIAPSGLVVMADDKNVQPVYAPAPIIREAVLKENPKIAEILKPVFASLDLVTLQQLNARVQVGGEPGKTVATDYLKSKGFLK